MIAKLFAVVLVFGFLYYPCFGVKSTSLSRKSNRRKGFKKQLESTGRAGKTVIC